VLHYAMVSEQEHFGESDFDEDDIVHNDNDGDEHEEEEEEEVEEEEQQQEEEHVVNDGVGGEMGGPNLEGAGNDDGGEDALDGPEQGAMEAAGQLAANVMVDRDRPHFRGRPEELLRHVGRDFHMYVRQVYIDEVEEQEEEETDDDTDDEDHNDGHSSSTSSSDSDTENVGSGREGEGGGEGGEESYRTLVS
jgi:hypothetical protein